MNFPPQPLWIVQVSSKYECRGALSRNRVLYRGSVARGDALEPDGWGVQARQRTCDAGQCFATNCEQSSENLGDRPTPGSLSLRQDEVLQAQPSICGCCSGVVDVCRAPGDERHWHCRADGA